MSRGESRVLLLHSVASSSSKSYEIDQVSTINSLRVQPPTFNLNPHPRCGYSHGEHMN